MSNKFGITDSLLDAVKNVSNRRVGQYTLGGVNEAMDPVGKADADIDNDGDVDSSDKYLHNRRKAISKAMGKDKVKINPEVKEEFVVEEDAPGTIELGGEKHSTRRVPIKHYDEFKKKHPGSKVMFRGPKKGARNTRKADAHHFYIVHKNVKEETKVDSKLENPHNCATHVYSEQWGDGRTVTTMHADPDEYGQIAWYDVMFEHGIEQRVPIEELKVLKSSMHGHKKRGK